VCGVPVLPLLLAASPLVALSPFCCRLSTGDWIAQKAVADRHLRVFVRHLDFDALQLREGIRVFVAEAYPDPALAPPAYVDPVLQGGALNAKPPKPPR
jgi:hypothetical protein